MKTMYNSGISLTLISMLLVLNSFAQKPGYKSELVYKVPFYQINKLPPFPGKDIVGSPGKEAGNVKVLTHFKRIFNKATNVEWEELDENFLAIFSTGDILTNSLFDKKGRLIYTINYLSEKQLPGHVKKQVVNKYEGYKITSVAEVLQDNREIWIVKLAGKNNYIAARIENEEMSEIENFQK